MSRKHNPLAGRMAKQVAEEPEAESPELAAEAAENMKLGTEAVEKAPEAPVQAAPTAEDSSVHAELKALREQMAALQARTDEAERAAATDEDRLFFLARSRGKSWAERQIRNKTFQDIQFAMTAFYGPFKTEEARDAYLAHKKSRPEGAAMWADVYPVSGIEKREIQSRERRQLRDAGAEDIPL